MCEAALVDFSMCAPCWLCLGRLCAVVDLVITVRADHDVSLSKKGNDSGFFSPQLLGLWFGVAIINLQKILSNTPHIINLSAHSKSSISGQLHADLIMLKTTCTNI